MEQLDPARRWSAQVRAREEVTQFSVDWRDITFTQDVKGFWVAQQFTALRLGFWVAQRFTAAITAQFQTGFRRVGYIGAESTAPLNADTKKLGVRHFSRFSRSGPSAPPAEFRCYTAGARIFILRTSHSFIFCKKRKSLP